ncbi:calcium-dependent protein kinase 17-like protein, partial [Tanacetum coccineum]
NHMDSERPSNLLYRDENSDDTNSALKFAESTITKIDSRMKGKSKVNEGNDEEYLREELEGLRAMFQNFNTDGNNVISCDKLKKSFLKLGSDLKQENIDMIVTNVGDFGLSMIKWNTLVTGSVKGNLPGWHLNIDGRHYSSI